MPLNSLFIFLLPFLIFIGGCTTYDGVGRFDGAFKQEPVYPGRPIPIGKKPDFSIDWPVDRARLTQRFNLYKARPHWGIDIAAQRGSPIYAAHSGTVVYAGDGFTGYGNLIIIEFDDQWATFYSHMDRIYVSQGKVVVQGEQIGAMGDTGRATGVHLHFEIRRNRRPIDPLKYLP